MFWSESGFNPSSGTSDFKRNEDKSEKDWINQIPELKITSQVEEEFLKRHKFLDGYQPAKMNKSVRLA